MPIGTCDPASRGETFNEFTIEVRSPNGSGSVLVDVRFDWDGVSTKATGCDGPITLLHTRNTSDMPAWALLPDKKKGSGWVQIDPGTDLPISSQGTLNNLGLSNASDAISVRISFVNPAG